MALGAPIMNSQRAMRRLASACTPQLGTLKHTLYVHLPATAVVTVVQKLYEEMAAGRRGTIRSVPEVEDAVTLCENTRCIQDLVADEVAKEGLVSLPLSLSLPLPCPYHPAHLLFQPPPASLYLQSPSHVSTRRYC
jgi:hypothetical protein